MFVLAFLVGIYSYLILSIGLLGILYRETIYVSSLIFILFFVYIYKSYFIDGVRHAKHFAVEVTKDKKILFLICLLSAHALVNLIGVLGPEISFDALWYHLTLPKIYLQNNEVFFIPGSLFYYSAMPKLTEMLYIPAVLLSGEILAKLIHFSFGVITCISVYKITREFLNKRYAVLASLLFYGNLVVGWESIASYVDLSRTFFESLSFLAFLYWIKTKKEYFFITSAFMLGLAVSSKVIALGSLVIYFVLIGMNVEKVAERIKRVFIFSFLAIFPSLPWIAFAYVHTGNPVYPFFTDLYQTRLNINIFPYDVFKTIRDTFLYGQDPISPIYLIIIPIVLVVFPRLKKLAKMPFVYSGLALLIWYLTPQTGGGRFILPYLPVLSVATLITVSAVRDRLIKKLLVSLMIFVFVVSIGYRFLANQKFIGFLTGAQSKSEFLRKNLNFSYGDFYDIDGFFKKTIKDSDTVLLYGFHNLYYADFKFVHSSYSREGDKFNYIATQGVQIPERFKYWQLIYSNPVTNVRIYTLGGREWIY